jgi:ABC-type uncharacterized transport system permease subunit
MRLVLERRAERSAAIAIASPLIAIAFTLVTMLVLFAVLGKNPIASERGEIGSAWRRRAFRLVDSLDSLEDRRCGRCGRCQRTSEY